ncbi:MAG: glucosidase [Acidobacteriota bacterium]|nr:glucosidase [Acidobacteriota bacterium]MDH3528469.1 glucosidase [Acidobacteriota bacterium]
MNAEENRLDQAEGRARDWKLWGPYVSERAWGTVREDYSPDGSAWDYFPFEHAHLRAFRWNEDGIAGICDRKQRICFSLAFWNVNDEVLKERLFGLAGPEGNHAEDVKEYYYYLDATPTASYLKFLYKYPQSAFPYSDLRDANRKRGKDDDEYELVDTGIFDDDAYFDVFIEYAKAEYDDIVIRVTAHNRGSRKAPLHLLPTVMFRNRWSWENDLADKPSLKKATGRGLPAIDLSEPKRGEYRLTCTGRPELLFTENETNLKELYDVENPSPYTKDGIGRYVVGGEKESVNPRGTGTKAAAHYRLQIEGGGSASVYLRLARPDSERPGAEKDFVEGCKEVFESRIEEAEEFYRGIVPDALGEDSKRIMRQSLAGMVWSKQFYHYVVREWLEGDPASPKPPEVRKKGRNASWRHLYNDDVVSMPDKWEYPWYAAWDLAFHCVPLALIDPDFAKRQLLLLLREWYMHPNGQIPAYEWAFGDVNPPVHAWAALRVYQIEKKKAGEGDYIFLEKIFHKLLLNFTWWVNRKDSEGDNVFEGGFLGLDNIGVFDRSSALPTGGNLEQSDGTSWMAMFCLNMLAISLELAQQDIAYEDVATKFFEHFIYISDAMNNVRHDDTELWNERDGFYYDVLHLPDHRDVPLKVRSMVGLIPLFAVETLEEEWLDRLPNFKRRTDWFIENRPDVIDDIACLHAKGEKKRRLLALVNQDRLRRVLRIMLSEAEFLSDYGIRALSRYHKSKPYEFNVNGEKYTVEYEPGESRSGMFGGNSNWRGPIWFPVNYLIIESLQKFDYYFGKSFKVEFPTGSERMLTLWEVSQELEKRLASIFLVDEEGRRPVFGNSRKFQNDEHFKDYPLFYEYFHGDNGKGLGASHQTGWTGLIGKILKQIGEYE